MNETIMTLKRFVAKKIHILQEQGNSSSGKAILAQMRRGIGKKPGELPELWGIMFEDYPEGMMSNGSEPTREEWAVYEALTQYSLHQQGKEKSMQQEGFGLGKAVAGLVENREEDLDRIMRRFNPLVTATDMREVSHYLRTIVNLLKDKDIPLDYPMLAADLLDFQWNHTASGVRLRWGQDFFREINRNKKDESEVEKVE